MRRDLPIATAILLLALLPAATCQPRPGPTPPPATGGTTPAPDAGPGGGGQGGVPSTGGAAGAGGGGAKAGSGPDDACAQGQANLERLQCPQAHTDAGTPFAVTCRDSAADGRPYPVLCIIRSNSCEEAVRCR